MRPALTALLSCGNNHLAPPGSEGGRWATAAPSAGLSDVGGKTVQTKARSGKYNAPRHSPEYRQSTRNSEGFHVPIEDGPVDHCSRLLQLGDGAAGAQLR